MLYGKAKEHDTRGTSNQEDNIFRFGKEGDELAGRITEFKYVDTKYGNFPLLKIREEKTNEEYTVFASPRILQRKLEEVRPEAGDEIDILFEGEGEKGTKYFRVYLERKGSRVAPDASQSPEAGADSDIPF